MLRYPWSLHCESATDKNVGLNTHHSWKSTLRPNCSPINKLHANLTNPSNNVSFLFWSSAHPRACAVFTCCVSSGSFTLQLFTSSTSLLFVQFQKLWPSACVHPVFPYDQTPVLHSLYVSVCWTSPPPRVITVFHYDWPSTMWGGIQRLCSDPHPAGAFIDDSYLNQPPCWCLPLRIF